MAFRTSGRQLTASMRRFAEHVAAAFIAIIFVAFIIQIVFRYVFNLPVGWTSELSVVAWLWLVLWGAAFVLRDDEEIRFDLLTAMLGRRSRIVAGLIGTASIVVLFVISFPATFAYVSFMKVERTSYLNVRFDWLFSIYLLFAAAVIVRYAWNFVQLLRGIDPAPTDSPGTGETS